MQHKALMIIITMYAMSFSLLTVQYVFGDYYWFTITSFSGAPLKSNLLTFLNGDALNTVTSQIANTSAQSNSTLDAITNAYNLATGVGFEVLQILTGTYIFNLLYIFDLPAIFIGGLLVLFVLMAAIGIIAYIRGSVF